MIKEYEPLHLWSSKLLSVVETCEVDANTKQQIWYDLWAYSEEEATANICVGLPAWVKWLFVSLKTSPTCSLENSGYFLWWVDIITTY